MVFAAGLAFGAALVTPQTVLADEGGKHWHAAFTVAELGEMLWDRELPFYNDGQWTNPGFYDLPTGRQRIVADTEADARGEMLIYLLENRLITPPTF